MFLIKTKISTIINKKHKITNSYGLNLNRNFGLRNLV